MRDHKCWNDDINSLELYQGQQRWAQGKAAMTVTAGSDVQEVRHSRWASRRSGSWPCPSGASGPYAGKLGSTSQTVGITAWTKYPEEAADFIMFMHTPERMAVLVQDHGRVPGRRPLQHEAHHAAAAEGPVRPREATVSVPRELHPDRARLEGELRGSRSSCSAEASTPRRRRRRPRRSRSGSA